MSEYLFDPHTGFFKPAPSSTPTLVVSEREVVGPAQVPGVRVRFSGPEFVVYSESVENENFTMGCAVTASACDECNCDEDEVDIDAEDDAAYIASLPDGLELVDYESEIYYWHPHTLVDRNTFVAEGRATVAYQLYADCIVFGVAFCSLNDNFSRPFGRELALSRFNTNPTVIPTARLVTQVEARKAIAALISIGNIIGLPGYPTVSSIQIAAW